MIFKTFDTDLNGLINKVGFFNKSLKNIGRDFRSGNGLFTSLFSGNYVTQKDIQAINAFSAAMKSGSTTAQAWQAHMTGCTVAAKQQVKQCLINKGSLSELTDELNKSTISAKAAAVATKALTAAGNMLLTWGITQVINLAVQGIEKLANASKYTAEKAKSLAAAMGESIKSMSGNSSTLSELNAEYKELSKGVNYLGENVNLSTEQYNRYKVLISQISDIMPNLSTYFNDQGEKIAFAKGNLSDLNEEYDKYVQKQAIKYVSKGDDDGNKIQDILNKYNSHKAFTGFEGFWKQVKYNAGFVDIEDFTSTEILNELKKLRNAKSAKDILNALQIKVPIESQYMLDPDLFRHNIALKSTIYKALGLDQKTQKELQSMSEADYNALMQKIIAYMDNYNAKIAYDMDQVKTVLLQEVYSKDSFWGLDKDVKNDITTFISSIDSDIWDALNIQTDHELSVFVNDIIDSMTNNTNGFADAWNNMITPELEHLSPKEYAQEINKCLEVICDTLGLDKTNGVRILKIGFGFEDVDAIATHYINTIQKGTDKFSGVSSSTYGNNADADLYYEEVFAELDAFAKENSINTQDEIAFWNQCIEESNTRQEAMDKYLSSLFSEPTPASFSDIFSLQDAEGNLTALGKVSESIGTIQNAYRTLSSAVEEYNDNGAISFDTLQSVIDLGDDWLDYLVDEKGALKLDQESLEELTRSRLEHMRIQTLNNLIDQVNQIKNNADANRYLASTNYAAAESFEELARTSALATQETLRQKVESGHLSQAFYDAVINKMYGDINKINALFDNTTTDLSGTSSAASSALISFTDLLDKELAVLDRKMEAGYADFNDYIRDRLALIEDYYRQGKLSADEYYSYLEQHYDTQLSYMDKAVNAVTRRIDKEIDGLEKQKDAIEQNYQHQIDYLNEQKTLLEDANKERQRQIDLQKAQYELERAKNQRTMLVYSEDRGLHYATDDTAIKDAQQEVEDAEFDIRIADIESSISKLEEARDTETAAIDAMIEKLEEYKEQWNDITSAYEEEQENLIAAQIFGQDWESEILDGRLDTLNQFKDDYIAIQQAMVDAAYQAAQAIANGENTSISDTSKGKTTSSEDEPEHGWEVVDENDPAKTKKFGKTQEQKTKAETYLRAENKKRAAAIGIDVSKDDPNDPNPEWLRQFKNSNVPGFYMKKYHTGLQQGPVKQHSFDEDFKLIRRAGLGTDEVPAILKVGEAVATPEQIHNLADNIRQSALPDLLISPSSNYPFVQNIDRIASSPAQQVINQNITLNCPNVTNHSGVEYIQRELGHLSLRALQESKK